MDVIFLLFDELRKGRENGRIYRMKRRGKKKKMGGGGRGGVIDRCLRQNFRVDDIGDFGRIGGERPWMGKLYVF
jgi:hypothetical protein